jgi:hypothetical protein
MMYLAEFCGGGALLAFLVFLIMGTPGMIDFGFSQTGVLLWDGLFLCLLFFIQHSVMIRTSFRARLAPK